METSLSVQSALVPIKDIGAEYIIYFLFDSNNYIKAEPPFINYKPFISYVMQKAYMTRFYNPDELIKIAEDTSIPERIRPITTTFKAEYAGKKDRKTSALKMRRKLQEIKETKGVYNYSYSHLYMKYSKNHFHELLNFDVIEYRFRAALISLLEQKKIYGFSMLFMKEFTKGTGESYKEYIEGMLRKCLDQIGGYDNYIKHKKEYGKECRRRHNLKMKVIKDGKMP